MDDPSPHPHPYPHHHPNPNQVWTNKRRAFLIGIFSQFFLMPATMFGMAHAFGPPSR